ADVWAGDAASGELVGQHAARVPLGDPVAVRLEAVAQARGSDAAEGLLSEDAALALGSALGQQRLRVVGPDPAQPREGVAARRRVVASDRMIDAVEREPGEDA